MTKELTIRFKNGEKEAEMHLTELSPEHQLALIDGMFKFFDVDVAFKELAEVSIHTKKAYLDFYQQTMPVVTFTETNEEPYIPEEPPAEKASKPPLKVKEALQENAKDENNWNIKDLGREESHWYTGIKVRNGIDHFRCHYKCPSCAKKSTIYIKKADRSIRCYDCGCKMNVRPASEEELGRDVYGNFFIAGEL